MQKLDKILDMSFYKCFYNFLPYCNCVKKVLFFYFILKTVNIKKQFMNTDSLITIFILTIETKKQFILNAFTPSWDEAQYQGVRKLKTKTQTITSI